MRMPSSFYNTHEVSTLETVILTVLSIAAPCLIVFALYTFAAATILDTYRHLNHARNAAALHGRRRAVQVRFACVLPRICSPQHRRCLAAPLVRAVLQCNKRARMAWPKTWHQDSDNARPICCSSVVWLQQRAVAAAAWCGCSSVAWLQ